MNDLWRCSATDIAARVASAEVKPTEVLDAVLERIDALNPALNAVTFDGRDEARADAERADAAVAAGAELGALHGVPVTIKENVDVAGQPTPNGLVALAELRASEDAPLVRNLRAAGAVVVGRTNTPEFSMRATTDNPLRGRTFNPWGADISPGGSSGGAGAAAAAGMGPLHHGNDIGGSLRFPAFANGVTTVKPTSFRVPVFNSTAMGERGLLAQTMSVQGLIVREVADIGLAYPEMIRPDPRDPLSPPVPWEGPRQDEPVRVAVTTASHGYAIHPGIVGLIERAAGQLADAGYAVDWVDPPPIIDAARGWFSVGMTELSFLLRDAAREVGSETVNDIFEAFFAMSDMLELGPFIAGLGDRTRLIRDWSLFLDAHPLVLCPFLMRPMFDWDYDTHGPEAVRDLFESAIYSTGVNYLGLPAGVIGMDLVEGRPAGVQVIGPPFREDTICAALAAIEAANGVMARRLWDHDQSNESPNDPSGP